MRHPISSALALVVSAAFLAACSAGDADSLGKDLGEVRAETQRLQKDNEKLATQVAAQARRIDGLTEDLNHVRGLAMEVKVAPAPKAEAAAAGAPDSAAPAPAGGLVAADGTTVSPEVAASLKKYLSTEEGKKALEAAVVAERDARSREQQVRNINTMIDRFAKTANLTEDQAKKMKDIMGQALAARGDVWSSMRDLGPDATPEQRDEARKDMIAKTDELRKQTDTQIQGVLDSSQFIQYQQEQDKLRAGGMRGFGAGGGAGGGGGRAGRPNGN